MSYCCGGSSSHLQIVKWKSLSFVWVFVDPMDCRPPGCSIHGIFQARILQWVATSSSRGSPQPRDKRWCPASQADSLPSESPGMPTMRKTWVWSPGWEDPLEKEMATHSSTLAWKIPWMEEPGRLQSMALQRVRHDWETSLTPPGMSLSKYQKIPLHCHTASA